MPSKAAVAGGFPVQIATVNQPDMGGFPTALGFPPNRSQMGGFPSDEFDPLWQYVVLQCHFNKPVGTYGTGTVGLDASAWKHLNTAGLASFTAVNTKTYLENQTVQSDSVSLLCFSTQTYPELMPRLNDFTIEMAAFFTGVGGVIYDVFSIASNSTSNKDPNYFEIQINVFKILTVVINGIVVLTGASVLLLNRWYQIAYSRINGVGYLYLNGQLEGAVIDLTDYNCNSANNGVNWTAGVGGNTAQFFSSEARLTIGPPNSGAGRYQGSNYAVQTDVFPDQSGYPPALLALPPNQAPQSNLTPMNLTCIGLLGSTHTGQISFVPQGTILTTVSAPNTSSVLSNWYVQPTTNIGASYWIKFTLTAGTAWDAGIVSGALTQMNAARLIKWTVLTGTRTTNPTTVAVTIYADAAGALLVGSGTINVDIESNN